MNRIKAKLIFSLFALVMIVGPVKGQTIVPMEKIEFALKNGNVNLLSMFFGNTVDITINNDQSTYSSPQAKFVLRKFFRKNQVSNFDLEHTGTSASTHGFFSIGCLVTNNGKYKVYMYLKQQDNIATLQEIRIIK